MITIIAAAILGAAIGIFFTHSIYQEAMEREESATKAAMLSLNERIADIRSLTADLAESRQETANQAKRANELTLQVRKMSER